MKAKITSKGGKILTLEKGEILNPNGRPKGSRNKAKLASEVIELSFNSVFKKHPNYQQLIEAFPNILDIATIEEVIYLIQAHKAIFKEDTNAAHFIINRARGTKPDGQLNQSTELRPITAEETKLIADNLRKMF